MTLAWALAAALQVGPTWSEALRTAKDKDTLVLALVREGSSEAALNVADEVMADNDVKAALKTVVVMEVKGRSPQGFRTPKGPYAVFFDEEAEVRGFTTLLTTPSLFARTTRAVFKLWKDHDSLEFRTRRAGSDQDVASAARSFAFRFDRPRSKGLIARLKPRDTGGPASAFLDDARAALAEACLVAKDRSSAEDAFRTVAHSKDVELAWSARLGLARLYADVRPKDSETLLRQIAESQEAPALLKRAAEAMLEGRSMDRGS